MGKKNREKAKARKAKLGGERTRSKSKPKEERFRRETTSSRPKSQEATRERTARKQRFSSLEEVVLSFFRNNEGAKIPVSIVEQVILIEHAIDSAKVKKAIQHLIALGAIDKNKGGLLSVTPKAFEIESVEAETLSDKHKGILSFNQHGTGFIKSADFEEDVKVLKKHSSMGLPGDEVEFVVLKGRNFDRLHGKITSIVQRSKKSLVGTLHSEGSEGFYILPDDRTMPSEFFVAKEHLHGAEIDDKVSFSILEWSNHRGLPKAEIKDILGKKGSNEAEIRSIMVNNQIRSSFPAEVEDFVNAIPNKISSAEIARRLDLRDEIIFTIDPADAKDFDDALSIKILENGNYYLGVHIADVTHFLPQDSVLDREALDRATSTYLVDRVIPMLPEKLSNGLCSLNPDEDTLTFSCFMEIDKDGLVVDYEIKESIIHSTFRFAYEDAQKIIDGTKHHLAWNINTLWELAQKLLSNRMKMGAVDFDTPEPKFVLDKNGVPTEVKLKLRLPAHRLIEECMLLANKTVSIHIENLRDAKQVARKSKELYPFLYRVHDKPDTDKLINLAEILAPLNIEFVVPLRGVKHATLNKLIKDVKGTPVEHIVNSLMLRSMAKAVYSPKNIGHFGLNFKFYTHFTSPIRRYPDVIVHRLLKAYSKGAESYNYEELFELGEHTSERERGAMVAERESVKLKQTEYMNTRIGQEFDGVINGVTEYGMYILLKENFCEGMIRVSNLRDDYYDYDSKRHTLFGKRRGRQFRLGDEIKIRVVSVDLNMKTIDFALAEKK